MSSQHEMERLQELLKKATELNGTLVEDMEAFRHQGNRLTFFEKPDEPRGALSVTTSCSGLMALAHAAKVNEFYGKEGKSDVCRAFELVVEEESWKSAGLEAMNSFTCSMVLRAFGFLVQFHAYKSTDLGKLMHKGKWRDQDTTKDWTLEKVLNSLLQDFPSNLGINDYLPAVPTAYWLVDAIWRSEWCPTKTEWEKVYDWSARQFMLHHSRLVSENDALMDPVSLAMAACLCSKLHKISSDDRYRSRTVFSHLLPSKVELTNSLAMLFLRQGKSGIWPKYFPMFHYPEAGANFCFTFEMLEAVLNEFNLELFADDQIVSGMEKAVTWCEQNRLNCYKNDKKYTGWNSGGSLQTLSQGIPETWATAVVHMFLCQLVDVLTDDINRRIRKKYRAVDYDRDEKALEQVLDMRLPISGTMTSVKKVMSDYLIAHNDNLSHSVNQLPGKRSALLFGPPGTSKTTFAKALARRLGWPLISLDPSIFLQRGIHDIYGQASEVFDDLQDLRRAVVLFDEMDALVLSRDESERPMDIYSRFLTTSMLPKLAQLHDTGKIIFLMTTNHIDVFDDAIKRPGRFDLLICMSPPSWTAKLEKIEFFLATQPDAEVPEIRSNLERIISKRKALEETLDLFTFGDLQAFLDDVAEDGSVLKGLLSLSDDGFQRKVKQWGKQIPLRRRSKHYKQWQKDLKKSRIQ